MTLKYGDKKTAYVVWTNTDLTEGRGQHYPLAICEYPETATRLASRRYVMGSDCPIGETQVEYTQSGWIGPIYLIPPSQDDLIKSEQRIQREEAQSRKKAVLERARQLGLTQTEIDILIKT